MKKKIITYIFSSDDVKKDFLLYEEFYREACKKFKKFYFINLTRVIDKKKSNNDKKFIKKKFPKNLVIIEPKNYQSFKSFLDKKEVVTFIAIGRELKYFKTLYILKKYNCKLLINLTIGYTGQSKFSSNYNLSLNDKIKFYLKYFLFNKMVWVIFRFLVLFNFFPKIEILFEGSKKNVRIYNNYLSKKINRRFPLLNLNYIKNIEHVNFRSFERLLKQSKKLETKYVVFLDSGFGFDEVTQFDEKITEKAKIKYYLSLKKLLIKLSKIYNKKIVVCLHPKTNKNEVIKYLNNIDIKQHQTLNYITKSEIVLFHDSSSILDAIFLQKKIINIRSSLMGNYYKLSNKKYSRDIKIPVIHLSEKNKIDKKYIESFFNNKKELYINYINNFLTFDLKNQKKIKDKNDLKGSLQMISIIKSKFFND